MLLGPSLMLGICSLSVLVLHETLLVPVLMYDSETMLWKEKERSGISAVQWVTSETSLVLGGWIEFRMHGQGSCAE